VTAPVDVLAVMDIAATSIEQSGGNVAYLRQARAAVAELMDEARRCCAGTGDLSDLRAALARVKGGAA